VPALREQPCDGHRDHERSRDRQPTCRLDAHEHHGQRHVADGSEDDRHERHTKNKRTSDDALHSEQHHALRNEQPRREPEHQRRTQYPHRGTSGEACPGQHYPAEAQGDE